MLKHETSWRHVGVHPMRFTDDVFPDQSMNCLSVTIVWSFQNTYNLLIVVQWQTLKELEHITFRDTVNHPDLSDDHTTRIWEFACIKKKAKKEDQGCYFDTVDVLPDMIVGQDQNWNWTILDPRTEWSFFQKDSHHTHTLEYRHNHMTLIPPE